MVLNDFDILGYNNYAEEETHHDHEHWKELQLAKAQTDAINKALQKEVQVKNTDTVEMAKDGNWQNDDLDETISANVRLAGGENAISSTTDGLYAQDHTKTIVRIDGDIDTVKDNIGGINNRIDNLVKQSTSGANVTEITDARRDYQDVNWSTLQANIRNNQSAFFESYNRQLKSAGYYQQYEDVSREMNGYEYNKEDQSIKLSTQYRSSKTLSVEAGDIVYFKVQADPYIPPYAFIDTADQMIGFRPPSGETKVEEYTVLIPKGVNRLKISTTTDGALEIYTFDPTPTWEAKDPQYKLLRSMELLQAYGGYYTDAYETSTGVHIKAEHTDTDYPVKNLYFKSQQFDPFIPYVKINWESWITNPYAGPYNVFIIGQAQTASGATVERRLAQFTHKTGDVENPSDLPNVYETHVTGTKTVKFQDAFDTSDGSLISNTGRIVVCIQALGTGWGNVNAVHAKGVIEMDLAVTPVDELQRSENYDNNLRQFLLGIQQRIDDLKIGDSTSDTSQKFNKRLESLETWTRTDRRLISELQDTQITKEQLDTKADKTTTENRLLALEKGTAGNTGGSGMINSLPVLLACNLATKYDGTGYGDLQTLEKTSGGLSYSWDTDSLTWDSVYRQHVIIPVMPGDIINVKYARVDRYTPVIAYLDHDFMESKPSETIGNIESFVKPNTALTETTEVSEYFIVPEPSNSNGLNIEKALISFYDSTSLKIYRVNSQNTNVGVTARKALESVDPTVPTKITQLTKRVTDLETENSYLQQQITKILEAYPLPENPATYTIATNNNVPNTYFKKVDGTTGKTLMKNIEFYTKDGEEVKNKRYIKQGDSSYKPFYIEKAHILGSTYLLLNEPYSGSSFKQKLMNTIGKDNVTIGKELQYLVQKDTIADMTSYDISQLGVNAVKNGADTLIIEAPSCGIYSSILNNGDYQQALDQLKNKLDELITNAKSENSDVKIIFVTGWVGLKVKKPSDSLYDLMEEMFTWAYSNTAIDVLIDLREKSLTECQATTAYSRYINWTYDGNTHYRPNDSGNIILVKYLSSILLPDGYTA